MIGFPFNARPIPTPCAAKRPRGDHPSRNPHPGRDRARPLPSYRKYSKNNPPSHPGKKFKGRARRPFLWSFQGGHGGKFRNPPVNLSSGVWGCILLIRKEYIPRCRQASLAPPVGQPATDGGVWSPRPTKHQENRPSPDTGPKAAGFPRHLHPAGTAGHPGPQQGGQKRAPVFTGALWAYSGFTSAMCSSSSCFCVTSLGALIITSWAFLFMGKGMISRMESSPARSITMRSTPGAMPAWGGAP